ncbi:hypothetical protein GW17_00007272 [Ensete ventricosum]|nr:hypothetical protein GW17_00007272 [Ensete ventricosum]
MVRQGRDSGEPRLGGESNCRLREKKRIRTSFPRVVLVRASLQPTHRSRPQAILLSREETKHLPAHGERSRRLHVGRRDEATRPRQRSRRLARFSSAWSSRGSPHTEVSNSRVVALPLEGGTIRGSPSFSCFFPRHSQVDTAR